MRKRNVVFFTLILFFGLGSLSAHAAMEPWQEVISGDLPFSSHSTCFLPYAIDDVHICGVEYAVWRGRYGYDPLLHADGGTGTAPVGAAVEPTVATAPAAEAAGPGAEWLASSGLDPTYFDRMTCFPEE